MLNAEQLRLNGIFLTVFGFIADIQMSDPSFIIPKKYFIGVTCFLTFNLSAMLGNMVPSLFQWVSEFKGKN